MAKKKRRASRAPQLKKDREAGYRKMSANQNYDEYTIGNHISSSAKVGNILQHMSYASTDMVPYIVSTSSRYNALAKERRNIVDDMSSSINDSFSGLIDILADGIAEDEEKTITGFVNALNGGSKYSSADQALASLNEAKGIFGKLEQTVVDRIDKTMDSLLTVYQRFLSNPNFQGKATTMLLKKVYEGGALNLQSDKGLDIKYSESVSEKFMAEFFAGVVDVLDLLQKADFFGDDFLRLEQALTFLYSTILKTANQLEGGGISIDLFKEIDKEFHAIVKKMETDLKTTLNFKGGRYAFGFISEIMVAYAHEKVLQKIVVDAQEIEEGTDMAAEDIKQAFKKVKAELLTEIFSGKGEGAHKTSDTGYTYGGFTVKHDLKHNTKATINKHKGFVYNVTSLEVDFKEEYESMRDGGVPNSVFQMYRILMLNMAAAQGYSLGGNPVERQMYVKHMLDDENRFIDKFMALDTEDRLRGYPSVVSMNGYLYRFSDVVRKMSFENDFIAELAPSESKKVHVRDPYPIDAAQLYMEKVNIGHGKRIEGFAETIPSMKGMVEQIEREYFNQEKKRKVLLRVCLR